MKIQNYIPRAVDDKIDLYLTLFGAVCIEGPKWCGKTWSSAYHSKSFFYLGSPQGAFQNRKMAEMSPDIVFEGKTPRLIDEWQDVPLLWDAVRFEVDKRNKKGQFILTGSATPNHKGILHSGAGRIGRLRMRPMSLYESKDSTGEVSLKEVCEGKPCFSPIKEVGLLDIINLIIRGGWPANVGNSAKNSSKTTAEYLYAVLEDDVFRIDGIKRDASKMKLLLKSLARNESSTASNRTLKNDISSADYEDIDIETTATYLDIFDRLFLTDNQRPFSHNMRSSVRIKQMEKRHLADPSLACALLGAGEKTLLSDLSTLGFLFEALCERDLKVYADTFDSTVYHYQDYKNREIDAVIEMQDGSWAAFEIKLGANQIDEAAANLIKIRDSLKAEGANYPKVMGVICGLASAAYCRKDGVLVIPITSLKW
ncbi:MULTISPECIES: ATP-binding protein [unclassified Treponema]|uniref:ATP-binding protein n=1 Tax=unclassified Treponema TaxID=2638727 RepID=UPI0020A338F8|nr:MULTISPECIES: DUF4143 domain-containing protein [unclassified Treponema]UTC68247.1 ATP-binding protein [Treponema sp. OMZ 789]UTC70967.1 ATP-binding protein [Treponema sp. OMZ 790]UTC73707.1 ATP-binding protein [Treponema sp. OMZ 791]